jgi:predicted acetylornithine/succinylornithine family transaminase
MTASLAELQALESEWLMPTYRKAPVAFVRGEGARLWDADGKEYLDFLAGISVCSVGHCHPAVTKAVTEAAGSLTHVSNLFYSEAALRFAERLVSTSLGGRAFLCNSGTEANEAAIKLARKHAHDRGIAEPEIVVLTGAFHGRSMGAVSATPKMAANPAFAPYLPGFVEVPRDDPAALTAAVGENTAAVMLEPIQGETGIHVIPDEMIQAARDATRDAGALLVFDEIQCGMGRTGSLWAYEQLPAHPDVMTSAKALGGGLPVGACVVSPEVGDGFEAGDHGSTFAGGPLVAGAALAALEVLSEPGLLREVRRVGTRLCEGLEAMPGVDHVRGRGLMLGVGLVDGRDSAQVTAELLEAGLIVNAPAPDTLRLLPPLVIGDAEADRALEILSGALGV